MRRVALLLTLACGSLASRAASISVGWENLEGASATPAAALYDADTTTPLSAGSEARGDGAVVALGYFTRATASDPFAGEWVPLTGPQAANIPLQKTSIGDANDSGTLPAGFFTLQTDFDPANSALYQRIPEPGTPLAIAIYNRASIGASTHFNIATHPDWIWPEPHPILPAFVSLNLTTPGTTWFGGAPTARRTAVPTEAFPGGAARAPARLVNISTRGWVGTQNAALIPGFVIAGTGSSRVLVRVAGETLHTLWEIPGILEDPTLTIVRQADGAVVIENDDWGAQAEPATVSAAFRSAGAFDFPLTSKEAAVVHDLPVSRGGYTVIVAGKDGGTGIALAEVYLTDTNPDAAAELVNISTRGFVRTGNEIMIPGFVVGAGGPRRLLIRAAGPSWAALFNLEGVIADPMLSVVATSAPQTVLAANDNWSDDGQAAAIAAAAAQVGAFALRPDSRDAALVLQLAASDRPRGFTVLVSGPGGATGLVLTEIYELP